jgi:PAS domain S-box-containing protein
VRFLGRRLCCLSLRRWRELKQDVLERKSAEDVLSESEERFRSLIENASDIITILDKDGAVCYHSPSIERVLQYKAESAIGKSVFGFIHPDDLPDAIKTFKHAVEQRSVGPTVEYRCRHRDGSWRVLESIGKPLFKNSEVTAVVVNSRDITERKQADEALRQSERDYRELFEQAHDAIFILTPEDEIVLDVNQRACEIYGFNREEFIGLSIESISQNVPRGKEQIQQTLSKGSYLNFETIQLRKTAVRWRSKSTRLLSATKGNRRS